MGLADDHQHKILVVNPLYDANNPTGKNKQYLERKYPVVRSIAEPVNFLYAASLEVRNTKQNFPARPRESDIEKLSKNDLLKMIKDLTGDSPEDNQDPAPGKETADVNQDNDGGDQDNLDDNPLSEGDDDDVGEAKFSLLSHLFTDDSEGADSSGGSADKEKIELPMRTGEQILRMVSVHVLILVEMSTLSMFMMGYTGVVFLLVLKEDIFVLYRKIPMLIQMIPVLVSAFI